MGLETWQFPCKEFQIQQQKKEALYCSKVSEQK